MGRSYSNEPEENVYGDMSEHPSVAARRREQEQLRDDFPQGESRTAVRPIRSQLTALLSRLVPIARMFG